MDNILFIAIHLIAVMGLMAAAFIVGASIGDYCAQQYLKGC